jgi:hypothetical protein
MTQIRVQSIRAGTRTFDLLLATVVEEQGLGAAWPVSPSWGTVSTSWPKADNSTTKP